MGYKMRERKLEKLMLPEEQNPGQELILQKKGNRQAMKPKKQKH